MDTHCVTAFQSYTAIQRYTRLYTIQLYSAIHYTTSTTPLWGKRPQRTRSRSLAPPSPNWQPVPMLPPGGGGGPSCAARRALRLCVGIRRGWHGAQKRHFWVFQLVLVRGSSSPFQGGLLEFIHLPLCSVHFSGNTCKILRLSRWTTARRRHADKRRHTHCCHCRSRGPCTWQSLATTAMRSTSRPLRSTW